MFLIKLTHFFQVLRKYGFNPSDNELKNMIRNVDKNSSDGGIDFHNFIELMVKHGSNIDEDIAQSFKEFDIDGDGLISKDELHVTMNNLSEPMNDVEVKAMMKLISMAIEKSTSMNSV